MSALTKQENAEEENTARPGKRVSHYLLAYVTWTVNAIAISLIFGFQSLYPQDIAIFSNVVAPIAAGVSFVAALFCVRKYGFGFGRFNRVWVLFALGTAFSMVAESIWTIYNYVLNVAIPYPSAADIFYIAAYVPLFAGFVAYLQMFSRAMTKTRLAVAAVAIALSAIVVLTVVVPIEFSKSQAAALNFTDALYPILDLSLLSVALLCLVIFINGKLGKWWLLICGGAIFNIAGDELFLYQTSQSTYYNGSASDLLFIVGYLFFALAFYVHRKEL